MPLGNYLTPLLFVSIPTVLYADVKRVCSRTDYYEQKLKRNKIIFVLSVKCLGQGCEEEIQNVGLKYFL